MRRSLAVHFLKDICLGIDHLHKNGIIHRDLAARNVLLRKDETNTQLPFGCVLTDMGTNKIKIK
jgi:serine/threonine protein kinase